MSNRPNLQVMSRPHGAAKKNSHHPVQCLRLGDFTPGRRIILINTKFGYSHEFTVLDHPYVGGLHDDAALNQGRDDTYLKVRLRRKISGETEVHFLQSMGVIPDRGGAWNTLNFAVDARKAHLFPEYSLAYSGDVIRRLLGAAALLGYTRK